MKSSTYLISKGVSSRIEIPILVLAQEEDPGMDEGSDEGLYEDKRVVALDLKDLQSCDLFSVDQYLMLCDTI